MAPALRMMSQLFPNEESTRSCVESHYESPKVTTLTRGKNRSGFPSCRIRGRDDSGGITSGNYKESGENPHSFHHQLIRAPLCF